MSWIRLHWVHRFLLGATGVETISDCLRFARIEFTHRRVGSGHRGDISRNLNSLILSFYIHHLGSSFRHWGINLVACHLGQFHLLSIISARLGLSRGLLIDRGRRESPLATWLDPSLAASWVYRIWYDKALIIGALSRVHIMTRVGSCTLIVMLMIRFLGFESNWPIRITCHLDRLLFQHVQLLLVLSHQLGRIFIPHVGVLGASWIVREVVGGARDPIDPLWRWLLDIGLLLRADNRTQLSSTGMSFADKWWACCNLTSSSFQTAAVLGLLLIGDHGWEKWYVRLLWISSTSVISIGLLQSEFASFIKLISTCFFQCWAFLRLPWVDTGEHSRVHVWIAASLMLTLATSGRSCELLIHLMALLGMLIPCQIVKLLRYVCLLKSSIRSSFARRESTVLFLGVQTTVVIYLCRPPTILRWQYLLRTCFFCWRRDRIALSNYLFRGHNELLSLRIETLGHFVFCLLKITIISVT